MHIQALIFGLLIGGGSVAAWASLDAKSGGVPAARQVPAASPVKDDCCLIPANRGLYRTEQ